jgi:hypothetical protein
MRGMKKPLNALEVPVRPDIKRGPPIYRWTRKHWTVDPTAQKQIEHIPQLTEAAVLYQNKNYNSQYAYGKHPTYTTYVNKEFRPPLLEQEDILPLSRIPRPVIVPRINPGTAFSSGNSRFAEQNGNLPGIEKYLTDRVKQGQIMPTFFAPISMPEDNSVLPDLEVNVPLHERHAGTKFPSIGRFHDQGSSTQIPDGYHRTTPEGISGQTPTFRSNIPDYVHQGYVDGYGNHDLTYNLPVSDQPITAGYEGYIESFTPIDLDLEYNRPQVSAGAGYYTTVGGAPIEAPAFNRGAMEETRVSERGDAGYGSGPRWFSPDQSANQVRGTIDAVREVRPRTVANSGEANRYAAPIYPNARVDYREKSQALTAGRADPQRTSGYIPRAGISTPSMGRSTVPTGVGKSPGPIGSVAPARPRIVSGKGITW